METKICSKCKCEKPVTQFHGDKYAKDGKFHSCKTCVHEREVARYRSNPEYHKQRARQWERENPERAKEQKTRWNSEARAKGYFRKWYWDNHDKELARQLKWRTENPEKNHNHITRQNQRKRENGTHWYKIHPEKSVEYRERRRARKYKVGGTYTKKQFLELCDYYGNKCLCCGASDKKLVPDHVVPLVKQGANTIENIQPLCEHCNKSKGTKTIDYRPNKG